MTSTHLLRPDNHELFVHVRLMAIAREPAISWEDIARNVGLDSTDVPELLAWFLSYRLPPMPKVRPRGVALPRDPGLRAELIRLYGREESLVTVAREAPAQLARVQIRIASLERAH